MIKTTAILLLGLTLSISGIGAANDSKKYQVEFVEGGEKVKARIALQDDQLQWFEGKYDERQVFSIPRRDIRKVQDAAGLLTFELTSPVTYRGTSRSSLTVKVHPEQSNEILTWYGRPGFAKSAEPGTIVHEEVAVTVEHRHAVPPNCKGRLIAGADTVRYESSMPEHSKTWNYADLEKVDRNAKGNEVILKARGADNYVFTGMREGSDSSILSFISSRMKGQTD
jgi:hypothetical protein